MRYAWAADPQGGQGKGPWDRRGQRPIKGAGAAGADATPGYTGYTGLQATDTSTVVQPEPFAISHLSEFDALKVNSASHWSSQGSPVEGLKTLKESGPENAHWPARSPQQTLPK
jgi:hypothetical protein